MAPFPKLKSHGSIRKNIIERTGIICRTILLQKNLRKREGTGIIIRANILQKNLGKRGNLSTITVNIRMTSHLLIMGLYLNLGKSIF